MTNPAPPSLIPPVSAAESSPEIEQARREFAVGLKTLRTEGLASADDLVKWLEDLRDTGIGFGEAKRTIDLVRLNTIINPAAIPVIVDIGQRLSVLYTGGIGHTFEYTRVLVRAIEGGITPMVALGIKTGSLSGSEGASLIELARKESSIKATQAVVVALRKHLLPASAVRPGG